MNELQELSYEQDGRGVRATLVAKVGGACVRLTGWDETEDRVKQWAAMCMRCFGIQGT